MIDLIQMAEETRVSRKKRSPSKKAHEPARVQEQKDELEFQNLCNQQLQAYKEYEECKFTELELTDRVRRKLYVYLRVPEFQTGLEKLASDAMKVVHSVKQGTLREGYTVVMSVRYGEDRRQG